ncbi:bifunctional tRNA (5-methylaminomethyl-2-thiouridine)(34)-methyltransferase MnmD/FAD-dependent 5-carboxymethylaminomethyl-2-thiouridine(34) oxidoreductase MnmC [Cupriavidus sp. AU9028]|uniref:bifunctional tRNA (5-methylaminomethyl-2-thiouridine)(34)-methyltransferase MnmD/FAD-dependent 5-carboxymethylaminomethyl-2-thiouridine(34) oxidoreductase MnmC n=1 Tax=Cupriavidus sp. AU9028 TaxID=2871157 RepID=UPI001C98AB77|nr:bifunctional tRNA (5-methylaminomethyl-2-thiouridine)(34)-methyltransferase MnmD/FAD-dependent 5-carboxymethylaminomethyl-2-thiouridine(34) oxidoreductase MnmC [Cupriavidus sp. AU9028]MBY4897563.1 bifunctional tRNA (5-methylaminomethyl-2-thiouridine)(34)-methyltransferase MnmD/FAD-dependent 5-carboxymethylaminomethyl-2-thiouridine(34) oxidoreductase MnmC [Cupriavidus sp. AU9028]
MSRALETAEPILSADGTPYSPRYDDVYHSVEGGLAQARHVFLGGNGLPQRWGGRHQFVIAETGFGQGLNFLATWQAWREDPDRCGTLHFVSIEKHPFTREGLATVHASLPADLAPLAASLREDWPLPIGGLHRLAFDGGAVVLTLAFGDVESLLPRLSLGADAFYLDGFSPSRNAEMWQPGVMKGLARLARDDATLATYTAAGFVRRGLQAAGFEVAKAPGFGTKRDMTIARLPGGRRRRHPAPLVGSWSRRKAIVVGAGLSGCAMTERLTARGWDVTLIDACEGPAGVTSSHRAAAMHPHLSVDDAALSRLSRAGNLYARRYWEDLARAGHPVGWHGTGVLQIGRSDEDEVLQKQALDALALPEAFLRWMSADEAATAHGAPVPRGGLWFPLSGWAAPPDICAAQLAMAAQRGRVSTRFGCHVAALRRSGDLWELRDDAGGVIASAPVVVLANADAALQLLPLGTMPIRRVRGQLTTLPPATLQAVGVGREHGWPDCVISGAGYLLPLDAHGVARIGSSYEPDEGPLVERTATHAANLARLSALLPPLAPALQQLDLAALRGYVGVRSVSYNRLPWVGALPDEDACAVRAASLRGAHLRDIPRLPGLYGLLALASRGLTWAALGAELVASRIEGEPLPVESDLADALDPARLLLRALRHGEFGLGATGDGASGGAPADVDYPHSG